MKYEHRAYYDSHHTGNYTEDKTARFSDDITEDVAKKYAELWNAIGCTHYETSEAHFYEKNTDARHYTQYILYK